VQKKLSDKPQRRGEIYCSPFCGAKCTYAAYLVAQHNGKTLARRLGKGWTFRVWENLGWHSEAISPCGRWKVGAGKRGDSFTAFLGEKDSPGGQWAEHGSTPQEAIMNTRAKAFEEITRKAALLDLTTCATDTIPITREEGSALRIYLEEAQRSATTMASDGHDGPWEDIARSISRVRVKLGDSGELR
jgi:hypothetical protein